MDIASSDLARARSLLQQKAYRDAHAICLEALKRDPQNGEAFFLLGILTADHQNHAKAIELFDRAIASGFQSGEAEAQAARSLIALNRKDEAVATVEKAISRQPENAFVLDTIGVVLSRSGHHQRAVAFYQDAVARAPDTASYHYNLGAALQFLGQFSGAAEAFRTCLSLDPGDSRALVALATLGAKHTQEDLIPALIAAWASRPKDDPDRALQIAHALARGYEDREDPAEAMVWLEKGKAEKRATLNSREGEDAACFEAAMALAMTLPISETPDPVGSIFIVGMPRTGTTLTDRILSSHPDVTSAGELSDFSIALKRLVQTPGPLVLEPDTLNGATQIDLSELGEGYLRIVADTLGVSGRFTDKMPLNAFFAPIILAALPQAQVICLRRHPADTVLSNYRQLFATSFSYYAYAYDLEATARYTAQFFKLIDAYQSHLPPSRFKVLDYENLVRNQEQETRELLAFAGLSFDLACLNFHENAAPVATASATQVRQPIYSGSMGRWRKYRPALDPALEILKAANVLPPDDL
ncbi:MAG: tetratricopeptide repeat-containing sulfotransferase family protein [Henriciella sp.]